LQYGRQADAYRWQQIIGGNTGRSYRVSGIVLLKFFIMTLTLVHGSLGAGKKSYGSKKGSRLIGLSTGNKHLNMPMKLRENINDIMAFMISRRSSTMRYDYLYAKHYRGNPPPFQKSKRGFDDWVRSFQSIDQHPYDLLEIQSFKEQVALKKKSIQESDPIQHSINTTEPQHIRFIDKKILI
jgi:hypothetical protein